MSTREQTAVSPGVRADARRNRERILIAAREAFAHPGSDVSMAEVSRRAGVGMATLYRNFASRRGLLEALYAAEADAVLGTADISDAESPGVRLSTWLRRFAAFAAEKRHVAAELLTQVPSDAPIFDDTRARVVAVGQPLFDRAQRAGEVRDDVTFEQALQLIVSVATVPVDASARKAMLATIFDGLSAARSDRGAARS